MSIVEVRVCGRYKLGPKIANGAYGNIYLAKNVQTGMELAIKTEHITRNTSLLFEGKILQSLQGGIGIPNMHWCGQEQDFNFLVIELLGSNLEDLFNLCGRKFSLKTVLMIADQVLTNLEYIHFKHYIHRDIKPENFLVGLGKRSRNIFTVDFGLCKKYRDPRTNDHIPFKDKKPLIGTARYASIQAHKGFELSRRDDLESLGYMLIYFLTEQLPWQGLQGQSKEEKYSKIKEVKMNTPLEELCRDLPPEFLIYMNYVRNLKFEEKPDYTYLKKILKERFVKEGYEFDYVYDWILIPLSVRKQNLATRYPITIDVINNEEEFLRQQEEINYSIHGLEDNASPRILEEEEEEDEESKQGNQQQLNTYNYHNNQQQQQNKQQLQQQTQAQQQYIQEQSKNMPNFEQQQKNSQPVGQQGNNNQQTKQQQKDAKNAKGGKKKNCNIF